MFDNLWVEKYRPKTLSEYVISDGNRKFLSKFNSGEIPHLLFTGHPGIGKTTLAKIIVNEILKTKYLYINASDENGIDTIRNKVIGFAQTRSITDSVKVVILDESDSVSGEGQRALRNAMEEYSKYTRFILTANYRHRIIEPIQSRCQLIDLTFTLDAAYERINFILQSEKVQYIDSDVLAIVKDNYPDLRKTINTLQKFTIDGKLVLVQQDTKQLIANIYKLVTSGHALKAREYMIKYQEQFNNDFVKLLKDLFDYVDSQQIKDDQKKMSLITIHEYIYKAGFVMDQEINTYACLLAVSKLFLA